MHLRRWRIVPVLLLLALIAGACGGGESEPEATAEASASTSSSTSSTTTSTTTTSSTTSTTTSTTAAPAPELPAWAPGSMTAEQFDTMLRLIQADLDGRALDYVWLDGAVEVDETVLGFTNLAGALLQNDESEWKAVIDAHFDAVLAAADTTVAADWETAAPNLRIRMKGTDEVAANFAQQGVYTEIADGLFNVAFYDFPDTAQAVSTTMLENWGVSGAEVQAVALANTFDSEVTEMVLETSAGFDLWVVVGTWYSATLVNALDGLFELEPGVGAIVAVPTSDVILVHPIVDQGVLVNVFILGQVASSWWADGPASASPDIYWYRDGELSRIDLVIDDSGGRLDSIELTDLAATLPPG